MRFGPYPLTLVGMWVLLDCAFLERDVKTMLVILLIMVPVATVLLLAHIASVRDEILKAVACRAPRPVGGTLGASAHTLEDVATAKGRAELFRASSEAQVKDSDS